MVGLTRHSHKLLFVFLVILVFMFVDASGLPSGGSFPPTFTLHGEDWYDSWGYNRNYYGGADGYMPNLAYETLGANKEQAYSLGQQFQAAYPSRVQRATSILKYVQRWTEYGYDTDNVVLKGEPQIEWAWNADEMAHMFNESTNSVAIGDCEDMAFLAATIYLGAGIDAALVLAPSHVALLIWLPEYANANYYWDIPDDGKEEGWIWVEATGDQNPLGWTPPDFNDGDWIVFPLGFIEFTVEYFPQNPQPEDDVFVTAKVVSARGSVSTVLLNYTIQGSEPSTLPMIEDESIYGAAIPKQPKGTTVTFSVSALDSEGHTQRSRNVRYIVGNLQLDFPNILREPLFIGVIVIFLVLLVLAKLARK
ncbi:MAG: hypothetical protein NWF11_07595 [Candidatus Bathyarchaeota archaeon]|nr:hypothetical protein [Candidatus Bathyarchaeota archaeon]